MLPSPTEPAEDVAALKAALAAAQARGLEVAAELAVARARASEDLALIAAQKLRIAQLERQVYGPRSERSARLIEQLSLTFADLAADATADELAAEQAVAKTTRVRGFERRSSAPRSFPDHLPRERIVIEAPATCACCGGPRLRKLGEDVTRTLESTPRRDRAPWLGVTARSPFCSPAGFGRFDQAAATGGRLASGSSLNGAMVSSVM